MLTVTWLCVSCVENSELIRLENAGNTQDSQKGSVYVCVYVYMCVYIYIYKMITLKFSIHISLWYISNCIRHVNE